MCSSIRTVSCGTHLPFPRWWSCCQEAGLLYVWLDLCCQLGLLVEQPVPVLPLDLARSRGCCHLLAACPVKSSRIDHTIVNENRKQEDVSKPCNCSNWSHPHECAKSHSPGLSLVILLMSHFSLSSTILHKADPPAS